MRTATSPCGCRTIHIIYDPIARAEDALSVHAAGRRRSSLPRRLSAANRATAKVSTSSRYRSLHPWERSPRNARKNCRQVTASPYFLHGFSAQLAEMLAEWTDRRIHRTALGFRTKRYSWGYGGACPDLSHTPRLRSASQATDRIGVTLTEEFQIEQSTAVHAARIQDAAAVRETAGVSERRRSKRRQCSRPPMSVLNVALPWRYLPSCLSSFWAREMRPLVKLHFPVRDASGIRI